MRWFDVVTGHSSCLTDDDVASCPGSSVPLTVVFILRSDRVLRFVMITAFAFTTLLLRDPSDLDDLQDWSENHHSDSIDDNSFKCR